MIYILRAVKVLKLLLSLMQFISPPAPPFIFKLSKFSATLRTSDQAPHSVTLTTGGG